METIAANRNKISKLLSAYPDELALRAALAARLEVNPDDSESSLRQRYMAGLNRTDLKELREAWFKGTATDVKNAEVLAGLAEREFPAEEFETFQKLFLTKEGKPKAKAGSKGALAACPRLEEIFYREAENLSELESKAAGLRVFASTTAVLSLAEELIGGYNRYKKSIPKWIMKI